MNLLKIFLIFIVTASSCLNADLIDLKASTSYIYGSDNANEKIGGFRAVGEFEHFVPLVPNIRVEYYDLNTLEYERLLSIILFYEIGLDIIHLRMGYNYTGYGNSNSESLLSKKLSDFVYIAVGSRLPFLSSVYTQVSYKKNIDLIKVKDYGMVEAVLEYYFTPFTYLELGVNYSEFKYKSGSRGDNFITSGFVGLGLSF